MATTCAHCGSADTAPLLDTHQCFTCGGHTLDGLKTLPDSLLVSPNHDTALATYGWPFDPDPVVVARSQALALTPFLPEEAPT